MRFTIKILHLSYPAADEVGLIPVGPLRAGKPQARLRRDAAEPLSRLVTAAVADGVRIVVLSGYRSVKEQAAAFEDAERRHGRGRGIRWVAPPGRSEHATGWAVDLADRDRPAADDELRFADTPAGLWLFRRAGEFGFEMSFPPGNWQNIGPEPWHFRFVGLPEARRTFHPLISVFCASVAPSGGALARQAYALGAALARVGLDLCNGGYGGAMAESARGAKAAGGATIGITVDQWGLEANRWIDRQIHARSITDRLTHLLELGDGYAVLPGGSGTLLELAAVWEYQNKRLLPPKPIVMVGNFWLPLVQAARKAFRVQGQARAASLVRVAATPDAAALDLRTTITAKFRGVSSHVTV